MTLKPDDEMLEGYLSGALSARDRRSLEAALKESPDLQARLDELREEHQTLEAVKDSFAIRLPESEEERIMSKCTEKLGTKLGSH